MLCRFGQHGGYSSDVCASVYLIIRTISQQQIKVGSPNFARMLLSALPSITPLQDRKVTGSKTVGISYFTSRGRTAHWPHQRVSVSWTECTAIYAINLRQRQ